MTAPRRDGPLGAGPPVGLRLPERPLGMRLGEARDLLMHHALRTLPPGLCSDVGAWLGVTAGQRGHPNANARARALLGWLRPDLTGTPEALEATLRQLWQNVGRTYAEFASIQRMVPEGRSVVTDQPRLDEAFSDERPLIVCFVHLGNWEVLGHQISSHPLIDRQRPITAVIMPPVNRAHAHIAERRRASLPVELVPMGRRVWHVVSECLRRPAGIVWLAGDEMADGRVGAPHFGRRPRTGGNLGKIVRLAAATGARVLPVYSERVGSARFRSHILPILEMPRGRLSEDEIASQVMRIDAVFAPIVRRLVTQWYMAIEFGGEAEEPFGA